MPDATGDPQPPASLGEIILYHTDDRRAVIQLRAVHGTVWLTQSEMANLFDTGIPNINKHIAAILSDNELPGTTISDQEIVQSEGTRLVRRRVNIYSLDMILAVGYRVRSPRGVQFRRWATTVLREYLIKGFALDDERLKDPGRLDYFDELLERIREIRASEKRFYQKVRDIFATSVDYDTRSPIATTFFATIQNKLIYAVTQRTAGELIIERGDPEAPNMGLTSWKGSRVRKADVSIAKNYLAGDEIDKLNRVTTMFLDYAELRAQQREPMTMKDWVTRTDMFIRFNEMPLLVGPGTVSAESTREVAHNRYAEFDDRRRERELDAAEREAIRELEDLETQARKNRKP